VFIYVHTVAILPSANVSPVFTGGVACLGSTENHSAVEGK